MFFVKFLADTQAVLYSFRLMNIGGSAFERKKRITTRSLYRAYTERGITVANVITSNLNGCLTQTKRLIVNGMSYNTQEHCYQRRGNTFPSDARSVEAILLGRISYINCWLFTREFLVTKIIVYEIDGNLTNDTFLDFVRMKIKYR